MNELEKPRDNVVDVSWNGSKKPPTPQPQYDEEYFLRGLQSGKSLYNNYRWLPDLTIPMVRSMADELKIGWRDTILDFGCARGYTVKAFREIGYKAFGVDVSRWAIDNADKDIVEFVRCIEDDKFDWCRVGSHQGVKIDWIVCKDVLEHIPHAADVIENLLCSAHRGVFAVVPLAAVDGFHYVVEDYEKDTTHVHRLTLPTWVRSFIRPGWSVEARYRFKGVKDNYYKPGWEAGNGFITARRVE